MFFKSIQTRCTGGRRAKGAAKGDAKENANFQAKICVEAQSKPSSDSDTFGVCSQNPPPPLSYAPAPLRASPLSEGVVIVFVCVKKKRKKELEYDS